MTNNEIFIQRLVEDIMYFERPDIFIDELDSQFQRGLIFSLSLFASIPEKCL